MVAVTPRHEPGGRFHGALRDRSRCRWLQDLRGIIDISDGSISERLIRPTEASRGRGAVLDDAVKMVKQLSYHFRAMRPALGVCVAELVDSDGLITSAHTIPWLGLALAQVFTDCTPVSVESDVRAGALAEALLGAGRSLDPFVYITVGTGISSSLVVAGRPFEGARRNALLLGSGSVRVSSPHVGIVLAAGRSERLASVTGGGDGCRRSRRSCRTRTGGTHQAARRTRETPGRPRASRTPPP
jgi:predicted NBD/HSP70 family sugar kinase